MNQQLINETISYIEKMEEKCDWEWGGCRFLKEIIEEGDMPELYYKLLKLKDE